MDGIAAGCLPQLFLRPMSPAELFKFKHSPHQAATNSTLAPRRPCSPPTKLGSSHSVIILLVSTSAANRPPSRVNMPQPSAANNFAASLLEQLPAELLVRSVITRCQQSFSGSIQNDYCLIHSLISS
jgi:hypothetical protein